MTKVFEIARGLNNVFPDGNTPYQIITRLAEECGELAKEVNHWEGSGVKLIKHGDPGRDQLAKEIQDVITCALQVAIYYNIESELNNSIDVSIARLKAEGKI